MGKAKKSYADNKKMKNSNIHIQIPQRFTERKRESTKKISKTL